MKRQNIKQSRLGFGSTAYRPFSWVLLIIVSVVLCHTASAQNVESQPVARLVTRVAYSIPHNVPSPADSPTTSEPAASPSLGDASVIERRAFEKTNQVRIENGLPPFVWDADLCRLARTNSENMARRGYFAHITPEGLRLRDRARAAGILHFSLLGENIAYNQGYDDPGAFAVERWMSSPGHRANILYTGFQGSAIGTFVSADGAVFLTQVFITR
jgi:uncharacterized protein YkwD